jgi:hypothetical protein
MPFKSQAPAKPTMQKNVVGKPLDQLDPFVGEWTVEGNHPADATVMVRGRSVFEWWGERTFLMHRSTIDHPDFPDSISVIGATQPGGGLAMHYFDTRAVHRAYDMTFSRGVWTLARKAEGPDDFDQRLNATFSGDGRTISAEWQRADPGAEQMERDFGLTYQRR